MPVPSKVKQLRGRRCCSVVVVLLLVLLRAARALESHPDVVKRLLHKRLDGFEARHDKAQGGKLARPKGDNLVGELVKALLHYQCLEARKRGTEPQIDFRARFDGEDFIGV